MNINHKLLDPFNLGHNQSLELVKIVWFFLNCLELYFVKIKNTPLNRQTT
jgi:hypothetical protein